MAAHLRGRRHGDGPWRGSRDPTDRSWRRGGHRHRLDVGCRGVRHGADGAGKAALLPWMKGLARRSVRPACASIVFPPPVLTDGGAWDGCRIRSRRLRGVGAQRAARRLGAPPKSPTSSASWRALARPSSAGPISLSTARTARILAHAHRSCLDGSPALRLRQPRLLRELHGCGVWSMGLLSMPEIGDKDLRVYAPAST